MGAGGAKFFGFGSNRLDCLEDAGMLYPGKIVEDLGLLAQRSVSGDRFARNRNRSRGSQVLGKNELEQAAFEAQQCDFGVLYIKHFRQHHADVERGDSLAQHGPQREPGFRGE